MLFSIITVSYNAEKTIRRTIESTLKQSFTDYEIVVQDGLSKDNTLDEIPNSNHIHIFSQKDAGIYDAMNQAIAQSKGEYLIFMNCGDYFKEDNVLEQLQVFILANPDIDLIYGNYSVNGVISYQPDVLSDFFLFRTPLCHQSMVIKRRLFEQVGQYDCKYKILADYNFTQEAWHRGYLFKHVNLTICDYLGGGVSESVEGNRIKEIERKSILEKNYSYLERLKYNFILLLSLRKLRIWLMSGHGPEILRVCYKKISNRLNS